MLTSAEYHTLRRKLIDIDNNLGEFHDELITVGLKETSTEYHVRGALTELWDAVADLTRRIQFAQEDEL